MRIGFSVAWFRRVVGVTVSVTFGGVADLEGTCIVIGHCMLNILECM